jgi:peptidoglycan/LPS O-acetylase OafA/YrhL
LSEKEEEPTSKITGGIRSEMLQSKRGTDHPSRILALDGLRTVAVLGVVWAHVWSFVGTPQFVVARIGPVVLDLNRIISTLGTGVDLFFVISGFLMYMMFARTQGALSWRIYFAFIEKRFRRIAPAYYVAVVGAFGFTWLSGPRGTLYDLFADCAFLHLWLPHVKALAPPFWSLATEWHFYLVVPVIVYGAARWGVGRTCVALGAACIALRFWVYAAPGREVFWGPQMPTRLIEFLWGVGVAFAFTRQKVLPRPLRGGLGFVLGAAITFAGRMLMVQDVWRHLGRCILLAQVMGHVVLTLGYAIVMWNVLASTSVFQRLLSTRGMLVIGKWSYSIYLWHWFPSQLISNAMLHRMGPTLLAQNLAFALTLVVVLPTAWASYKIFEAPYFRRSGPPAESSRGLPHPSDDGRTSLANPKAGTTL